MKTLIKTLAVSFAASCIVSCNGNSSTSTTNSDSSSVSTMDKKSDTSGSTMNDNTMNNNSSGDQDIVNDLVKSNTKEIAWLNAAITKSNNKEIRSHASMMLTDHKKLGSDVMALIAKKNFKTPDMPDTTNEVDINNKTGADWDKAWVDKMVKDHSDLLDHLNKYEGDAKDADLKTAVTSAKPVVQGHLDMAKKEQDKMK